MSTQKRQGDRNRVQKFQANVAPCFSKLSHRHQSWINGYVLYTRPQQQLLSTLRRFFEIRRDRNSRISARKTELFMVELK